MDASTVQLDQCETFPGSVIRFSVSLSERRHPGTLIDRGANGGLIGADAKVQFKHGYAIDVTGIDNHEIKALEMVDATAKSFTQHGPCIVVMQHYAYHGVGRTLHSAGQIEAHEGTVVDDRSIKVNGSQCIRLLDGRVIPLDISNGLPYMPMEPHTQEEFDTLPHVFLTGSSKWDPRRLDSIISDREDWYNLVKKESDVPMPSLFDKYGDLIKENSDEDAEQTGSPSDFDDADIIVSVVQLHQQASDLNQRLICFLDGDDEQLPRRGRPSTHHDGFISVPTKYEDYRAYFLNVPTEKVQRTFERTTQLATNVVSGPHIRQTYKSPNPALNVQRRDEPVATDTVFAGTQAIGTNGQKMAQIFVGRKSLVIGIHGMHKKSQYPDVLMDEIRTRGAMKQIISDSAREETTSARVKEILRTLVIDDWQSEPNYQHQNFAEHRWQHIKRHVNWYMNWRNVDPGMWLECLKWVADIMNHTAEETLGWRPPLEVLTGRTIDISPFLYFLFWDKVYFERYDDESYSNQIGDRKSSEVPGRFVGIAWNVGHAITFKVLTEDSRRILCR